MTNCTIPGEPDNADKVSEKLKAHIREVKKGSHYYTCN